MRGASIASIGRGSATVAATFCRPVSLPRIRRNRRAWLERGGPHGRVIRARHTGAGTTGGANLSVGTAFHPRTAPLNRKMQWREWSGYYASSAYADFHDIEYNAIREAAAVIDVSPLYKYRVTGPDAIRLVDRVITRDATKLKVGQVYYTPWCDEHGKVIDDGTDPPRRRGRRYRWTAADPQFRWLTQNAAGLDVAIEDVSEQVAALALQGPFSRGRARGGDRRGLRRPALLPAAGGEARRASTSTSAAPATRATSATSCGSRPSTPRPPGTRSSPPAARTRIRPAGMLALDVTRLEAGLILLEVDYTSARHAMSPEQHYSPFEIGLGRLVSFDKADYVGRRALTAEQARGGPARRLVGLILDWYDIERAVRRAGPAAGHLAHHRPLPRARVRRGGRQVGKATSHGWSPILKQAIALASVGPKFERVGHAAPGRVDRRGQARPGRRDGRGAAVPRPRAQARVTAEAGASVDFAAFDRLVEDAPRALDAGARRVPRDLVRRRRPSGAARGRRRGRRSGSGASGRRSRSSSSTASRRWSRARSVTGRGR